MNQNLACSCAKNLLQRLVYNQQDNCFVQDWLWESRKDNGASWKSPCLCGCDCSLFMTRKICHEYGEKHGQGYQQPPRRHEWDSIITSCRTSFQDRRPCGEAGQRTSQFVPSCYSPLLCACKRGRPNLKTGISFLCTLVKEPDKGNYKKLKRVIRYIWRTKFLWLTMEASQLDQSYCYIDGAFAVHNKMRRH